MSKRKLTNKEIANILNFLKINPHIPQETSLSVYTKIKKQLTSQLKMIEIYPCLIPELKLEIMESYKNSLIQTGETVGVISAQSIGEKQTQSNLNTFHKAGSSDKQPTTSKFAELLNATTKPKAPCYFIHFNDTSNKIQTLRKIINHNLVEITLKKIAKNVTITIDKEDEDWYPLYFLLKATDKKYTDCISIDVNTDIIYEYGLNLSTIAERLEEEHEDIQCIYSPDCYSRLDIYVDTDKIQINEDVSYINQDNYREIYLEEVALPLLENFVVAGISGVLSMYFLKQEGKWVVETENSREKSKIKNSKKKTDDLTRRFNNVLNLPFVDYTKTISNNVWDIYYTFGIEAARQYMINQFLQIMDNINLCHIMILVDKMTYKGTISSISRYTMRTEDCGPFSKASFEETLDNFLKASIYGQEESTKGVSASIICGKRASLGTGSCSLKLNLEKLLSKTGL